MTAVVNRPYQDEHDLHAMIALLLQCRAAYPIARWPTIAALRLLCQPSRNDCIKHLWVDEDDALAAFAFTFRDYAGLYFFIDPQQQQAELAAQIPDWAFATHHALGNDPTTLTCQVRETYDERIAFLEAQGFDCQERYTVRMTRSLAEPLPSVQLPRGFTIRPVAGEDEAAARATVHEKAFGRDKASAQDVADRLALMRDPGYMAELDLVAVAPDGTFVAFCHGNIDREENQRRDCREGWTDPVGVHPDYQRKGLGRAVVLAACQQLRALGMETAILGTGSWNTAMQRCAESSGYRRFYRSLWYTKRA